MVFVNTTVSHGTRWLKTRWGRTELRNTLQLRRKRLLTEKGGYQRRRKVENFNNYDKYTNRIIFILKIIILLICQI